MIVQTGVKVNTGFDIKSPPDLRLYDVPDTYTVEKLVNAVEREHVRQIVQQVTGCKFTDEHLDAMQQVAVRLVATFKKEQQKLKFVSYKNGLPDLDRFVIIKTEPLYDGDTDIYSINRRTLCYCKWCIRVGRNASVWEHSFNDYEPFEWCYLNLETE